ncbi:MAG: hypothetical protein CM1200mP28_11360 [Deltaproteobacteria bacterium]|nr:MAG: hypothetical protein CM1200mP28_11360 [Deltaproteobacteria bacterium]
MSILGGMFIQCFPDKGEFAPIPTSLTLENDSLIIVSPVYESNPINAKDRFSKWC